jgi:hypothetical protein
MWLSPQAQNSPSKMNASIFSKLPGNGNVRLVTDDVCIPVDNDVVACGRVGTPVPDKHPEQVAVGCGGAALSRHAEQAVWSQSKVDVDILETKLCVIEVGTVVEDEPVDVYCRVKRKLGDLALSTEPSLSDLTPVGPA